MWEALAALGSIASAVVIAVTVIMAARQIRVNTDQLVQLRRATQFEAAKTVLLDLTSPEFVAAYRFVYKDLAEKMRDDAFRRDVALIAISDERIHQEVVLLRSFDRIGTYIRYGLVDREVVYSSFHYRIVISWLGLQEVVAIHRAAADEHVWENAQFLYDDCIAWAQAHGRSIDPRSVRERVLALQQGGSSNSLILERPRSSP